MKIKYKIIKTIPEEHQVSVRFYSDELPESELVSALDRNGNPVRYRTDYLITLPVPSLVGEELERYIMRFCPVYWFELKNKIADSTIDTSMTDVALDVGIEKLVDLNPPRELETVRTQKIAEISIERNTRETLGFTYMSKVFDSDSRSVQRINTVVQAAQAAAASASPFSIEWTCKDNTTIELDIPETMGIPVALAMHANDIHHYARSLKELCLAAETIEELDSINTKVGWPV